MTIELSEYVIDAIADAIVKKMQEPTNLMVVKVIDGVNLKSELMDYLQKDIIRQKETGVVILPWYLTPVVVPEDTEIRIESEGNNDTNSTADL